MILYIGYNSYVHNKVYKGIEAQAYMELTRILSKKTNSLIFKLLLSNEEGFAIYEIVEKTGLLQPAVSRAINELRLARLVKVELKEGKGVSKIIKPSVRGFFEELARVEGATLTEEDYSKADDYLFDPKIKDSVFSEIEKKKDIDADFSILFTSAILGSINLMGFKVKTDRIVQQKFRGFLEVIRKIYPKGFGMNRQDMAKLLK